MIIPYVFGIYLIVCSTIMLFGKLVFLTLSEEEKHVNNRLGLFLEAVAYGLALYILANAPNV